MPYEVIIHLLQCLSTSQRSKVRVFHLTDPTEVYRMVIIKRMMLPIWVLLHHV